MLRGNLILLLLNVGHQLLLNLLELLYRLCLVSDHHCRT